MSKNTCKHNLKCAFQWVDLQLKREYTCDSRHEYLMGTVPWNVRSSTACAKSGGQLTRHLPCCLCAHSTMPLSPTTEHSPRAQHSGPGPGVPTDTRDADLPCLHQPTIKQSHESKCLYFMLRWHRKRVIKENVCFLQTPKHVQSHWFLVKSVTHHINHCLSFSRSSLYQNKYAFFLCSSELIGKQSLFENVQVETLFASNLSSNMTDRFNITLN